MVRFRDHLRRDAADREAYAAAKRRLATRRWRHMQDYADAKTEILEAILQRAATDESPRIALRVDRSWPTGARGGRAAPRR